MDVIQLIISLISGLAGGNIAGALLKDKGLGAVGNSAAGAVGGGIGGYLLQILGALGPAVAGVAGTTAAAHTGFDIGSLLENVGGSGVGGVLLTVIVSLIRNAVANKV